MMRVGQKVVRVPLTIQVMVAEPRFHLENRPMKGTVVYVHKEGRYHTVEFETPGGPIRESFAGVYS